MGNIIGEGHFSSELTKPVKLPKNIKSNINQGLYGHNVVLGGFSRPVIMYIRKTDIFESTVTDIISEILDDGIELFHIKGTLGINEIKKIRGEVWNEMYINYLKLNEKYNNLEEEKSDWYSEKYILEDIYDTLETYKYKIVDLLLERTKDYKRGFIKGVDI